MSDQTPTTAAPAAAPPLGELVAQLSEQTSRLVRDELRLAQAETSQKARRAGLGAGLFGGAGLLSVYGVGALVAAAVLALAGPLPGWLAALVVAAALFVAAGVGAVAGKSELTRATPPVPEEAVRGVQQDARVLRSGTKA